MRGIQNNTLSALNCPKCGRRLQIKRRRKDGRNFLGCTGYPECEHTQPLPQDVAMRALGQCEMFPELAKSAELLGDGVCSNGETEAND